MTLAKFKIHYEKIHIPLVQAISGPYFPKSHTRLYIQRPEVNPSAASTNRAENDKYPAAALNSAQANFDYDAIAELIFEDQTHFQAFMRLVGAEEAAKTLAADEERFLDREKMRVVIVDERNVTTAAKTG